jgi:D-alanyl-D-alanine carboxypeptidase/D-alanyl-D-alanine-endopeptidase (penicillin-binding protein 4)
MLPSDNFIAEQLLLLCSDRLFDTINTSKIIAYAKDSLLADAPDQLRWYDGSGISRYNLFTPRTIVYVLQKMYQQYPEERLFSLFAQGGVSGTIRKWYAAEQPYIFAKTGTLRNLHCLSGYIKTDNGKTLLFSFMHNNFNSSSQSLKVEMQKILEYIKANF